MKKIGLFLVFVGLLFSTTVAMAYTEAILMRPHFAPIKFICCSSPSGHGTYLWKNRWIDWSKCDKGLESSDGCTLDSRVAGYGANDRIVTFK